ncbi:DNA repair protein [Mycena kentingensis (nom. inval.)]|nr:DNA repair protein [Mycena kentingensis (nom. inval.)]
MDDLDMPPVRPPLFFASSDEEDDEMTFEPVAGPSTSSPASSPRSDDAPNPKRPIVIDDSDDGAKSPRPSPPAKKRRVSSSPPSSPAKSVYLGDVMWGHAFSNVSGKGYIKNGDEVTIKRDTARDQKPAAATSNKGKQKGKGGQMSLKAMLKQPAKAPTKNKKEDTIVRLYNTRGFEFGRLSGETSSWVAKLLDFGIAEFRGRMVQCPEKLTTGCNLVISAAVDILPSAFKPSNIDTSDKPPVMFSEGAETASEQGLRERKASVLRLFDELNLRPVAGANFAQRKSDEEIKEEAMKNMAQNKGKGKKVTEVVGDGEEIEVEEGEELNDNDLAMIYKKAQKDDKTLGEMEPPDTFTFVLRGYQKQALHWMSAIELGKMDAREAASMHPLWSQYLFPLPHVDGIIDLTAEQKPFYFNPYSGELSLEFPKAERQGRGGILADEMGLGKTIITASLIHTNCAPDTEPRPADEGTKPGPKQRQLKLNNAFKNAATRKKAGAKPPSATLIVAPTSLLAQWESELQRCSQPGTIETILWHGQNRMDLQDMVEEDDEGDKKIKIVITSYGVLASEHAKMEKSKSPVFEIEWLRVVLDEAHACKSRTSKTAKAVYALNARRRWAVTGTPIVNKLEDLYSLIKFLDFRPWSDFSFFRSFITLPFLARDTKAIEIVQIILESILLRREKSMLGSDGKPIVELPSKEVTVEHLEFSSLERKIYDSLFNSAKRDFLRLDAKGLVGKNYTHILAMLMRLRRAVLHPNLVIAADDDRLKNLDGLGPAPTQVNVNDLIKRFSNGDDGESVNVFAQKALENLDVSEEDAECPVCLDVMEAPMVIPECMHRCCKDCIVTLCATADEQGKEARCPTCSRGPISENDLMEVFRPPKTSQDPEPTVVLRKNDFRSSTKLDALIQNLRKLRDQDPCFRAVVFSQFTSFLDLIEVVLRREQFEHYRFDGSMDVKTRGAAVEQFKAPARKAKILVVSLKAGGVGLNLTAANHVFMVPSLFFVAEMKLTVVKMDCWWNAATESQAIDRVHRIGQEKTVYVKHFIISNTIEGRILQIQKRKTAIVKEAFKGSKDVEKGKSDPESIENLKIMFGEDVD